MSLHSIDDAEGQPCCYCNIKLTALESTEDNTALGPRIDEHTGERTFYCLGCADKRLAELAATQSWTGRLGAWFRKWLVRSRGARLKSGSRGRSAA